MLKEEFMRKVMVHKNKMYRFALSYLVREEEAQDLVQDVLLKLWEGRNELNEIRSVEAWCMSLVRNKSLDKLKRAEHRMRVATDDGVPPSRQHFHEESPEVEYQNKELGNMLTQAIENLPERLRAAFHLRDVQGYSYIEIGEMLEIDMNQVKINIFRARKALKESLQFAINDGYGLD
jgi:RNA polymerase sigma-70 factor (ECF subfamily)